MTNSYKLAERINSDVNTSVTYKTDLEQYGKPEHWVEATTFGACEDYALLKRQVLLKSGFERKDLHLACCWDETGGYHCVLLCNTDNGWFVLDNRHNSSDWWCSELVAYLLKCIGMTLSGWRYKTNTYTPNMCYKWPQDVVDRSVF